MVDSNIQREGLLPSEKAFAYKMKVEALRHQGKRSVQPGQKSSRGAVAENAGESETQVQRYIRLTNLEKPLLSLVDEGRIALTPGAELSFLTQEEQKNLLTTMESEDATPSLAQAQRMKKLSQAGQLDMDAIFSMMTEEKGNQKETVQNRHGQAAEEKQELTITSGVLALVFEDNSDGINATLSLGESVTKEFKSETLEHRMSRLICSLVI